MYAFFRSEIVVGATSDFVFELCRNVEEWSRFMPAVKQAFFLEQSEDKDKVQITAEANEQVWTWQSNRTIDRRNRTIAFKRIDPMSPIAYMKGTWEINPLTDHTTSIVLSHEFELSEVNKEKFEFLSSSIKRNSKIDLDAIKNRAESI